MNNMDKRIQYRCPLCAYTMTDIALVAAVYDCKCPRCRGSNLSEFYKLEYLIEDILDEQLGGK